MLTKIKIENFKSIEYLLLELAPLTIFVRPNMLQKQSWQ
jgi:AAA15 family ATPase/GTPase